MFSLTLVGLVTSVKRVVFIIYVPTQLLWVYSWTFTEVIKMFLF
jgi:hypothetical protein